MLQYAQDRLAAAPPQLADVARQVSVGDISVVMRPYEDGLRHPLQAALFGTARDASGWGRVRTAAHAAGACTSGAAHRTASLGDLVRLMLIQVQKTKVDVEVAMAALDKLLKANELNFTLLTVVPAVIVLALLAGQVQRVLAQRKFLASGDVHRVIRTQLQCVFNFVDGGGEVGVGKLGWGWWREDRSRGGG